MPNPVHPFTSHQARWTRAVNNLSSAHASAKDQAVSHIKAKVTTAAERARMSTADIGVFWHKQQPHLSIAPGPTADREYGTLISNPEATIRNAASRADDGAAKVYHRTLRNGLGI